MSLRDALRARWPVRALRAQPPVRALRAQWPGRALRAQWPLVLVGLVFLAAFILVAAGFWRRGALLIGIGAGVAAALRLLLPEDRVGLLAVRSRSIDFVTTASVAAIVMYTAWTIDPLGTS